VASQQGFDFLVGHILDEAGPGVAHCGHKGRQTIFASPEHYPIDLHLFARFGFETIVGFCLRRRWFVFSQELAEAGYTTFVSLILNFFEKAAGRDPVRFGRLDALDLIGFERITLLNAFSAFLDGWLAVSSQIFPYGVSRAAGDIDQSANAHAVTMQHSNLH